MRIFHPLTSLAVARNLWLILLIKIWLFLNLVKHTTKNFQMWAYFPPRFCGCQVNSNCLTFHKIEVAKHIWDPWCHLPSISSTCLSAAFSRERQKNCLFLKMNFTILTKITKIHTKIVLVAIGKSQLPSVCPMVCVKKSSKLFLRTANCDLWKSST
jgi:hypothetical protein